MNQYIPIEMEPFEDNVRREVSDEVYQLIRRELWYLNAMSWEWNDRFAQHLDEQNFK